MSSLTLEAIKGRVIQSGDEDYDEARTVFYRSFDRRPVAIARPADADDVAAVVSAARESGLELAVRAGAHSVAGHSTSDGIVLDLRDLDELTIDRDGRTAWAGGGLTAGAYTAQVGTERARDGIRRYGLGRDRRAHARRRCRVSRPQARAHRRQPPRGGSRDGRRATAARRRRRASRLVLGTSRRRRQLRRRHPLPVPAARAADRGRRNARSPSDPGGDQVVRRRGRGGARASCRRSQTSSGHRRCPSYRRNRTAGSSSWR